MVKYVTEWVHDDVPYQWPSTQQPGETEEACRNRNLREAHARMAYQGFAPDVGTAIRTFRETAELADVGVVTLVEDPWGTSWTDHVVAVVEHYT